LIEEVHMLRAWPTLNHRMTAADAEVATPFEPDAATPVGLLLLFFAAAVACVHAVAQPAGQRIRGDVTAIDGLQLQVRTRTGENLAIALDEKYAVTAIVKRDLASIRPGNYVGTASMPQPDDTQRALEVLIFPESGRGSNEGHYPWDLQPGSMMTNATVAEIVDVGPDRRMTLRYKDGEKVVYVPAGAPIVTFEPGDRAMLVPGAHVILTATHRPDGTLGATRISVGKDGLVPPM